MGVIYQKGMTNILNSDTPAMGMRMRRLLIWHRRTDVWFVT